jgi:ribosomal protein S18 acetylase RimI-like enzyme
MDNTLPPFNLSDLLIRKVTRDDLPALEWGSEFLKYRRMYAGIFHGTYYGKTIMWMIELPGFEMIGQAFVMLKSMDVETADGKNRAYLFALRIKPQWRNLGIGQHLIHFIEDDLLHKGFNYVTLNVAKDNQAAIRLYQRMGYKIIGPRPGEWSFRDDKGRIQHVNEPSWRMMKRIGMVGN